MRCLVAAAAATVACGRLFAAGVAWDGGGGANHSWHLPANWTTDTLPTATTEATLGSGITPGLVIETGGADVNLSKLIISTTNAFTIQNTSPIGAGRFFLGGDLSRQDLPAVEADQNINVFVETVGDAVWDVNGSGWLFVKGASQATSGTYNFTKTGNGSLDLLGLDFNGTTSVNGGILRLHGTVQGNFQVRSELQVQGGSIFPSSSITAFQNATIHHTLGTSSNLGVLTLGGDAVQLVADVGSLVFTGITDNGAGYSITKSGAGTVALNGPGNYSGDTSINDGILSVRANNALGSGITTARNNGIFELAIPSGINLPNRINLNGGTVSAASSGSLTGPLTLVNNGTISVSSANTLTVSGPLTNTGQFNLTKTGPGILVLSNASSFYGGIVVAEGILRPDTPETMPREGSLTAAGGTIELKSRMDLPSAVQLSGMGASGIGALNVPSGDGTLSGPIKLLSQTAVGASTGASLTLAGNISGSFELVKVGPGQLRFGRNTNSFSILTVFGGQLRLDAPDPLPPEAPINVWPGATVLLNGGKSFNRILSLSGSAGALGNLDNSSGDNDWSGPVTLLADSTVSSSAGHLRISGNISGGFSFTKRGPNDLSLAGANTFPSLVVAQGTVTLESGAALGASSTTTVNTGTTLQLQNNISTSATGTVRLGGQGSASQGALFNAEGTNTFGGPVVLAATTSLGAATGTTLTLAGQISEDPSAGALPLVKIGAGTLVLANGNTYRGGTFVNAGTLSINGDSRLGDAANAVTLNNGGKLLITTDMTSGRVFNLNTGSIQVIGGATLAYNGAIVSGGFLRGPGTHAIGGNSSFSGVTALSDSVVFQSAPTTLANFTNAGAFTNNAPLTWDGGFNTGAGRLIVNSTVNTSGFENDGLVTVNSGASLINAGVNLASTGGSRITINNGGALNVSTNALDLNGALLVNNGTVTGTTNVNFGSLAKGSGVYGAVNVTDGGRFSPGNSPGAVTTGSTTWHSGGAYTVEIADALGGPGSGWDLWNIAGGLQLDSSGQFTIDLVSLSGLSPGPAGNFDPSHQYHWLIASSNNDLGSIDLDRLRIDSAGFTNELGAGSFSLSSTDNGIYVNFSAVPEPSALALLGLPLLLARRRRCKPVF